MKNANSIKRNRPPTHPGEVLREDVLPATGLTQEQLAQRLGVSRRTINEILNERRPVSVDMAHRLARIFNTTPDVWINMQTALDLWEAAETNKDVYQQIKPLKVA
jgi:addiction module HigA family antidote